MKILLVDDHSLFRAGLRHVLRQLNEQIEIVEAENCKQALKAIEVQCDFTLALLDLHMPGDDGFVALTAIARESPTLPIVVLSASESRTDMRRALDNGAMGFIPKSTAVPVMLNALRLVLAGGIYIPPNLLRTRDESAGIEPSQSAGELTTRQLDVLSLVLEGKTNKAIATELKLSEATVKAHITAVFKTLHVANRTQAALVVERLQIKLPR